MRVAVVSRDLMISTRIADAGARAGIDVQRFDDPQQLPPPAGVRLVFVAWDERDPDWGDQLVAWCRTAPAKPPRLVLFGPHADLTAHAAARAAGLGPMWARSKLLAELPSLLS